MLSIWQRISKLSRIRTQEYATRKGVCETHQESHKAVLENPSHPKAASSETKGAQISTN